MPSDVAQAITEMLLFWLINIYKAHNYYLTVTYFTLFCQCIFSHCFCGPYS